MKRASIVLLLALAACGPRAPGVEGGQTYFWRVVSSELEFGACSDEPGFRTDIAPLKFEENSYLIYKAAKDAKTATTQTCERIDPSTCKPSATNIVFTVAGTELVFSSETKSALGTAGCQLLDTTTWLLTDKGTTATLDITHVLSLTDNKTACESAEAQIKAQSPNMIGLEGCVITFKVGMSLK